MHKTTLRQLAEHVGGRLKGNPETVINSAATLEQAGKGQITFLSNRKYQNKLRQTKASAVILSEKDCLSEIEADLLVHDDPYFAFREIVVLLHGHREHPETGIGSGAFIDETAKLGRDCHIQTGAVISEDAVIGDGCIMYPGSYVGAGTRIGNNCILYPNAVVFDKCTIGNRVIIQANATVGQDGFGFATHQGVHHKIPHIGTVILEDDVEIGSGCAIERGTLDETIIGKGTKVGDLTAIGHGTKVGPFCLLVPQVGISGSTTLGHHCVAGGQAGITGHLHIGNCVMIAAQAGVINDVPDGSTILGAPATDANKAKRAYALIQYLPDLKKSIKKIKMRLKSLEKSRNSPDKK